MILEMREVGQRREGGRGRWVGGWINGCPLNFFLNYDQGRELCALPSVSVQALEG